MFKRYFFNCNIFFFILIGILNPGNLLAQVNLVTGAANVNVPFYSYSDGDRLSMSIGLQYISGNGIKVNELAANVGLGWNLTAGGVISREVAGKPDDQYENLSIYRRGVGRLYSDRPGLTDCYYDNALWVDGSYDMRDKEIDVFHFSMNGQSGSFVIAQKTPGATDYTISTLGDSKLKIRLVEEDMSAANVMTRISKFIITTEDGIEYTFSEKELTEVLTTNPMISTEAIPWGQFVFVGPNDSPPANENITIGTYKTGKYVVNNWHLTEIKNPLSNQKITLSYDTYDLDFPLMKLPIKTATLNADNSIKQVNYSIINQRFVGKMKRVRNIELPDYQRVRFNYTFNRQDILGEAVLSEIIIDRNNVPLNTYRFNYQYYSWSSYENYDPTGLLPVPPNSNQFRLSLKSINRFDGTQNKPFVDFTYKPGEIPERGSVLQDIYGYNLVSQYLNVRDVKQFFDADLRQPAGSNPIIPQGSKLRAQMGILHQIKYAAGGYMEYEYENNTCFHEGVDKVVGGVRVSKTTLYDGINHINDQVTTYKYVTENGASSGMGYEEPVFSKDIATLIIKQSTHTLTKFISFYANAALSLYNIGTSINSVVPTGRYDISTTAGAARYLSATSSSYNSIGFNAISTATQSSGFENIIDKFVSALMGGVGQAETINTRSWSGYPLNWQNALPLMYSRVEVILGDNNKNMGKEVYEFVTYNDVGRLAVSYELPYSSKQRVQNWAIGLVKKYASYTATGKPVKEVVNDYRFYTRELSDSTYTSCKCEAYRQVGVPAVLTNYRDYISYNSDVYNPYTGRAELVNTTTRNYSQDNNLSVNVSDYTYDPDYFNLKTEKKYNSKGEAIETRNYYAYNYTGNTALTKMVQQNMINEPIATETWLLKTGNEARLIGGGYNNYNTQANGDVKPSGSYVFQSSKPVAESIIGAFNNQLERAPAYFKQTDSYSYNEKGKIVEHTNKGNPECNIYDDKGNLIATIQNANYGEVAYTNFDEGFKGNWEYSTTGKLLTSMVNPSLWPLSGTHFYDMRLMLVKKLKQGLVVGKKYKVSYWISNGEGVPVNGPCDLNYPNTVKKLFSYNGYTCFEHEFTAGTQDVILSRNVFIENLRLFPADAQMVNYEYDSRGNVIRTIDANNNIVSVEYDEDGRPVRVIDLDKNIRKVYEYKD